MAKIFLFVIITILLFPGLALAQPQIHIPEQNFDFGDVDEGTQPEHYFEIVNKGTETLLIKEVVPT